MPVAPLSPASSSAKPNPAVDAVATLQAQLLDQRKRLIRFRDSSSMRRYSESSTKQRNSMVSGIVHCLVHTPRRWCQDMQNIVEGDRPKRSDKLDECNKLLAEFQAEAREVARKFIERNYLAGETPEPNELGDSNGDGQSRFWAAPTDEAQGLALKVSELDSPEVAKRRRKEIQLQLVVFSQLLDQFPTGLPVTIYPQCVCSYAGHTVCVSHHPGRNAETSVDTTSSHEFRYALETVGEALNITTYSRVADDGTERVLAGPPTASAFEGRDGRLYFETIVGLMPHFPPARGHPITTSCTCFLRPEAVCSANSPVSPGAYVTVGGSNSARLREQTRACAQRLCQEVVPRLAKELMFNVPESAEDLVAKHMKPLGINVSLLAVLLSHVPAASSELRRLIFTDMVARAARSLLHSQPGDSLDAAESAVSALCADLCNDERQRDAWQQLLPYIKSKFPGASCLLRSILSAPFAHVDLSKLILRITSLCGMKFSPGVTTQGSSAFHFSIQATSPLTQQLRLTPPRYASSDSAPSMNRPPVEAQLMRTALLSSGAAPQAAAVSDVLRQRAMLSGKRSFAYAAQLYEIGLAHSRCSDIEAALNYFTLAIDGLAEMGRTVTLAQCLCERGRILVRARRFAEAEADLAEATANLGPRSPAANSRWAAFEDVTSRRQSLAIGMSGTERSKPANVNVYAVPMFQLLAEMHEAQNQFREAEENLRHILAILTTLDGPDHDKVAIVSGNLGYNLLHQERHAEAEELFLTDIRIVETKYGKDSAELAPSLGSLAALYERECRFDESIQLHERDIHITAKHYGADHPNVATGKNNLAVVLTRTGRFARAAKLLEEALESRCRHMGEGHTSVGEVHSNIAFLAIEEYRCDREDDRIKVAEDHALKALSIFEAAYGAAHPKLLPALEQLNEAYASLGDSAKGAEVSQRINAIQRAMTPIMS